MLGEKRAGSLCPQANYSLRLGVLRFRALKIFNPKPQLVRSEPEDFRACVAVEGFEPTCVLATRHLKLKLERPKGLRGFKVVGPGFGL